MSNRFVKIIYRIRPLALCPPNPFLVPDRNACTPIRTSGVLITGLMSVASLLSAEWGQTEPNAEVRDVVYGRGYKQERICYISLFSDSV